MRERQRILDNLEGIYREAFQRAGSRNDEEAMARLDFEFQRDQLHLEALLDLRELLAGLGAGGTGAGEGATTSILKKAQAIRQLTRLR
jgi:hypothetical protein